MTDRELANEISQVCFKLNMMGIIENHIKAMTKTYGFAVVHSVIKEMEGNNANAGETRQRQFDRLMEGAVKKRRQESKHEEQMRKDKEAEAAFNASHAKGYQPDFFHIYDQLSQMPQGKNRKYGYIGLAVLFDKTNVLAELKAKRTGGMDEGEYNVMRNTIESIFSYVPPTLSPFVKQKDVPMPEPKPVEFASDDEIPF